MASVLLATASVHTTASACDYLDGRLNSEDTVYVLTVITAQQGNDHAGGLAQRDSTGGVSGRDAGDAANVARTRLFDPTVETVQREADGEGPEVIAATIRAVAEEYNIDEVVVGGRRGDPAQAGERPGSTVRALLRANERPIIVLPA